MITFPDASWCSDTSRLCGRRPGEAAHHRGEDAPPILPPRLDPFRTPGYSSFMFRARTHRPAQIRLWALVGLSLAWSACHQKAGAPLLAPQLLDDSAEMAAYLRDFPYSDYQVFEVPDIGKFYLDDRPEHVKKTLREGRPWEPHVLNALAEKAVPGSTALDIGAHIGAITLPLARLVGSRGRVYAFEPQKRVFRELVYNLELNQVENVVPLRFAVGSESAIIEMEPDQLYDGQVHVGAGGDKAELRTIDSFSFSDVSVIKIDVEGYEGEVLRGARKTIEAFHPVIVLEIFPRNYSTIQRALHELGYSVANLTWDPRLPMHDYIAVYRG